MKIKQLTTLFLGVLMIGLVSCEYDTIKPADVVIPDTPISFSTDIEPIFSAANCTQCHPSMLKPDLTAGKSYASITSLNLVVAEDPDGSTLMQYINNGHQTAVGMTGTQKALIKKWIEEGAKNN
jgi:hypothetical protein